MSWVNLFIPIKTLVFSFFFCRDFSSISNGSVVEKDYMWPLGTVYGCYMANVNKFFAVEDCYIIIKFTKNRQTMNVFYSNSEILSVQFDHAYWKFIA